MAVLARIPHLMFCGLAPIALCLTAGCSSTRPSVPEVARIDQQGWRVNDDAKEIAINGTRFLSDEISAIRTSTSARFTFDNQGASIAQPDGQVQVIMLSGEVVLVDPDGSRHQQTTDPLRLP